MKRRRIKVPRIPGTLGKFDPIKARRRLDPYLDRAYLAHEAGEHLDIGLEELASQYRRGLR